MRQIFVNLPVKDLERSKNFFSSLGFGFDARFTDDKAACLVIEKDSIYAMLITEPFFKTFTPRAVADAKSDHEVDDLVAKATAIWELLHMRSEPR
jgi:predicted lactoylglutathione lyase